MNTIIPFRRNNLKLTRLEYWKFVRKCVEFCLNSTRLNGDFHIILETHAKSTESVYFFIVDENSNHLITLRISTHASTFLAQSSFVRTQDYRNEREFCDGVIDFMIQNKSFIKITPKRVRSFNENYQRWRSEPRSVYYDRRGNNLMYRDEGMFKVLRLDEYASFLRMSIQSGFLLPVQDDKSNYKKPRRLVELEGFDKIIEYMNNYNFDDK